MDISFNQALYMSKLFADQDILSKEDRLLQMVVRSPRWLHEEVDTLLDGIEKFSDDWDRIAEWLGNRTPREVWTQYKQQRESSVRNVFSMRREIIARVEDHFDSFDDPEFRSRFE